MLETEAGFKEALMKLRLQILVTFGKSQTLCYSVWWCMKNKSEYINQLLKELFQ